MDGWPFETVLAFRLSLYSPRRNIVHNGDMANEVDFQVCDGHATKVRKSGTAIAFAVLLTFVTACASNESSSMSAGGEGSKSSYEDLRPTALLDEDDEVDTRRVSATEPCRAAMREAVIEMQAGGMSDTKLNATLDACENRADWIAGVREYPFAIGLHEPNEQYITDEIALICLSEQSRPACQNP